MESVLLMVEALRIGHRLVLSLAGEVDGASVGTLQRAVDRVRTSGAAEVWIDLTRVGSACRRWWPPGAP